jgi:hypothetical protein
MFNEKLGIFTYKNTIYQSKLKLLAIFVTILVCKQHTLLNIAGKTCSQAIRIWATLIQVNQDDSASV